ncbi:MAG TPA: hypothetical protein HPP97_05635 [Desulfuromonadales bacterium]|nr:hypothetical protein [Desulfuromonadales bacterium]
MSRLLTFLLVFLTGTLLSTSLSAASKRPGDVWNYYHFDGSAFAPGPAVDGSAFVAVREKTQPVVLTAEADGLEQAVLPEGSGAIAGICYLQSSGGKLGGSSGFKPYPRVPLLISASGKQLVTVQTDDHGYFVVVLPAGTYAVGSGPFTAEITVERGITTLVPLRAGKRMVD